MKHTLYLLFGIILISAATSVYYPLTVDNTLVYDESTNSLRIDTTKIATKYYSGSLTGGSASYLVYTALLTQSGTSAPVATVLENTLGGTVVWSYDDVGVYIGTLAGAFVIGQTACIMSPVSGGTSRLSPHSFNPDFVELYVYDLSDAGADDYLVSTFVEIRVYP
jgi:hypothetical protein